MYNYTFVLYEHVQKVWYYVGNYFKGYSTIQIQSTTYTLSESFNHSSEFHKIKILHAYGILTRQIKYGFYWWEITIDTLESVRSIGITVNILLIYLPVTNHLLWLSDHLII